jgi:hypothetical protein
LEGTGTYIAVQRHFGNLAEWEFTLRPYFGHIEDVKAERFGLFGRHYLRVNGPGGEIAGFDGIVEVFGVVVWIFAGHIDGFFLGEGLDALIGLDVDFDIVEGAVLKRM